MGRNFWQRSKKTPRSLIKKREEGKHMGEKEARSLKKKFKEMFRIQKKEINEAIKAQEAKISKKFSKK